MLLGLVLGGGLSAVAFVTSGGVALGSNTWTEILLLLLGAAAAIAVVLWGAPRPRLGCGHRDVCSPPWWY